MKGLGCRGLETEGKNMRVITRTELAHLSKRELAALYAWVSEQVLHARYESPEWRNGIFDFHHYHSTAHEALGIAKGEVTVVLGGPDGEEFPFASGARSGNAPWDALARSFSEGIPSFFSSLIFRLRIASISNVAFPSVQVLPHSGLQPGLFHV